MEVKINREIRNYTESMLFRAVPAAAQFFCPGGGSGRGAVLSDKALCRYGNCVLGVRSGRGPFAALGFFTYHGMAAEQFIWAWLRSEVLEPRELRFEASTLYYDLLKPSIDKWEKGGIQSP